MSNLKDKVGQYRLAINGGTYAIEQYRWVPWSTVPHWVGCYANADKIEIERILNLSLKESKMKKKSLVYIIALKVDAINSPSMSDIMDELNGYGEAEIKDVIMADEDEVEN